MVLGKRISSGRRSTTYYLRVSNWGPRPYLNDISVPRSFCTSVARGQTVCVDLFPGALNLPWYILARCN